MAGRQWQTVSKACNGAEPANDGNRPQADVGGGELAKLQGRTVILKSLYPTGHAYIGGHAINPFRIWGYYTLSLFVQQSHSQIIQHRSFEYFKLRRYMSASGLLC